MSNIKLEGAFENRIEAQSLGGEKVHPTLQA
jgi:hypothetical protein